jgi:two-component system chemotaxis response regulator CheB
MIRVLIVDDSVFMRTIIRDVLHAEKGIEIVGTATDGEDAIRKIRELSPDVMTLDVEMPRLDGLSVLRRKGDLEGFPRTIMFSSLTAAGAETTRQAMVLGADDFMLKPLDRAGIKAIGRELAEKIRNVVTIAYVTTRAPESTELAGRVALIGSSAGGPPMLDIVVSSLPETIEGAVVITQHMPEGGFTASLAARLDKITSLPVRESENGVPLRRGEIVVSKGGFHTMITSFQDDSGKRGGRLVHSRSPPVHFVRPAVDVTFKSAASAFGPRTVSAILSGMGNDGGEGMAALKAAGGATIVCREKDCIVYGMARSAIERKCVDKILPLTSIAGEMASTLREMGGPDV